MGRGGMDVQIAELAAEGEMLLRGDVLVAEEDHEVFGKRAMDLVHGAVGQRAREIDAGDLGADDRRQLLDADGLVRLALAGNVPVARSLLAGQRAHGVLRWLLFQAIVARYSAAVTVLAGAFALAPYF